ncbi:uncharacterized protein [Panulirus ornatus]|uniref:uncharacterized protein n=1 Tax=Panulirus ornatus TaxID=150431 RepID=UPI003A89FA2C
MKTLLVLVLAAVAMGQQFQLSRDFTPAVKLAGPGSFQQTGGSAFTSGNNDQFLSNSFQSTGNFQNNQRTNFRSGLAGSSFSSQSGSFQNNDQFQTNAADRNQFQDTSFQQNQQNALNAFQQISGNTFQSDAARQVGGNRLQSSSITQDSDGTFQSSTSQQNSGSRFQTVTSQQDAESRFQGTGNQQTFENSFQADSNQQNSANRFLDSFNQQNDGSRFQTNINQQNAANRFQDSSSSRSSQQSQFQDEAFQRSGSSFESFDNSQYGVFEPLNLPSGASELLGSISTSFTCVDRPYGYYADQDNFCRVFHVCNPALFSDGAVQTYQYSFMCGEGTVFDQKELTCVVESAATPCQESSNFYIRNQEFGLPQEKFF